MINSFEGSYRFLSNFYPHPLKYEGIFYPTAEHAYQASKTTDEEVRLRIAKLATPSAAKKEGQKIQLRGDWDKVKLEVMREILLEKFSFLPLKAQLLGTGDEELVEGNWWNDQFWGVCNGRGQNHLGKILMDIRKEYGGN